jgi:hypothetical protein
LILVIILLPVWLVYSFYLYFKNKGKNNK